MLSKLMLKDFEVAEAVVVAAGAEAGVGIAVGAMGLKGVKWGAVLAKRYHNGTEGVVLVDVLK
jgi:hypothetical protein